MFAYALASKPCSEATNKDSFIPRGLFFGWNKIRIHGGEFGDFPEDCGFPCQSFMIPISSVPIPKSFFN